ncbi:hypothetical protein ACFLYU_03150 [Candidatus Dependentiae bacterium]
MRKIAIAASLATLVFCANTLSMQKMHKTHKKHPELFTTEDLSHELKIPIFPETNLEKPSKYFLTIYASTIKGKKLWTMAKDLNEKKNFTLYAKLAYNVAFPLAQTGPFCTDHYTKKNKINKKIWECLEELILKYLEKPILKSSKEKKK